jgi:hypothetical protein
MSMTPHNLRTKVNQNVIIQQEDKRSEVNCSARIYGPEMPIFKWYLGKASVLNISTTRVYFSKYRQNEKGHYISTLFFKKNTPRDSGRLNSFGIVPEDNAALNPCWKNQNHVNRQSKNVAKLLISITKCTC